MSAAAANKDDLISISKTSAVVALLLMITPTIGTAAVALWRINDVDQRVRNLETYKEETIRVLERIEADTRFTRAQMSDVKADLAELRKLAK